MIGNALRQYAASIGFSEHKGIVYGTIDGYAVTLAQGGLTDALFGSPSGAYNIWINVSFRQPEDYRRLMTRIQENGKAYRVLDQFHYPHGIRVNLGGSFEAFRRFIAWLMPLLPEYAGRISKCPICGQLLKETDNTSYARLLGMAVPAHIPCIGQAILNRAAAAKEDKQIGRGLLGAALGGLLGSLPWIISYLSGFFVWIFGLIIGIGASLGYQLAGGKPCPAKYALVLFCTVFFALFSFAVCTMASVAIDIAAGELQGNLWGNVTALFRDEHFLNGGLQSGIIGLICALAGCAYLIGEARQELLGRNNGLRLP
jgi:hypothetical protein